jgi:transcriptional regulator with XRE-family HTH domain
MIEIASISQELEQRLGKRLRELRILKNLDQRSLAARAGVSLNALKHLEWGKGARVNSLVKVLRALDRAEWLESLAPTVSISPMQLLKAGKREPKRVRRRAAANV